MSDTLAVSLLMRVRAVIKLTAITDALSPWRKYPADPVDHAVGYPIKQLDIAVPEEGRGAQQRYQLLRAQIGEARVREQARRDGIHVPRLARTESETIIGGQQFDERMGQSSHELIGMPNTE